MRKSKGIDTKMPNQTIYFVRWIGTNYTYIFKDLWHEKICSEYVGTCEVRIYTTRQLFKKYITNNR